MFGIRTAIIADSDGRNTVQVKFDLQGHFNNKTPVNVRGYFVYPELTQHWVDSTKYLTYNLTDKKYAIFMNPDYFTFQDQDYFDLVFPWDVHDDVIDVSNTAVLTVKKLGLEVDIEQITISTDHNPNYYKGKIRNISGGQSVKYISNVNDDVVFFKEHVYTSITETPSE